MNPNHRDSDIGFQRHLNSYIHSVISLLKQYDRALSFEEIRERISIDLHNNYSLLQSIKKNPRIVATHNTLMFKPLYSIRCVDDLKKVMEGLNNEEGVEMDKLADSPVNIAPFVEELKEKNAIIVLTDLDGSSVVFNNDMQEKPVDPQTKRLWNQIRIPTYHDLISELNTAGLKAEKVENIRRKITVKTRKNNKNKRRIRITNTHVKGLDLSGVQDEN